MASHRSQLAAHRLGAGAAVRAHGRRCAGRWTGTATGSPCRPAAAPGPLLGGRPAGRAACASAVPPVPGPARPPRGPGGRSALLRSPSPAHRATGSSPARSPRSAPTWKRRLLRRRRGDVRGVGRAGGRRVRGPPAGGVRPGMDPRGGVSERTRYRTRTRPSGRPPRHVATRTGPDTGLVGQRRFRARGPWGSRRRTGGDRSAVERDAGGDHAVTRMQAIGSVVGCADPPAGSTVMQTAVASLSGPSRMRDWRPPAAGSKPAGRYRPDSTYHSS